MSERQPRVGKPSAWAGLAFLGLIVFVYFWSGTLPPSIERQVIPVIMVSTFIGFWVGNSVVHHD